MRAQVGDNVRVRIANGSLNGGGGVGIRVRGDGAMVVPGRVLAVNYDGSVDVRLSISLGGKNILRVPPNSIVS